MRRMLAVLVLALLMGPVTGSLFVKSEPIGWEAVDAEVATQQRATEGADPL